MAQDSAAETVIGAVVIAIAAGFLIYASQSAGLTARSDGYELKASFTSVEGLTVGTDVRMAGVKIGSVTGLGLNHDTYQAEATFAIDEAYMIPDDSDVKVSSEGLLGGNFVEISPGASEFMLADGDEILLTQGAVSFLNLLMKFAAGDEG